MARLFVIIELSFTPVHLIKGRTRTRIVSEFIEFDNVAQYTGFE